MATPAPAVVVAAFQMDPLVPLGFAPGGDPQFGATDLAQQLGLDDGCAALFDDLGVSATEAGFADDLDRLIRQITDRLLPGGGVGPDQFAALDACVASLAPDDGLAGGSLEDDGIPGGGVPFAVNGSVGGSSGGGGGGASGGGGGGASGGGGGGGSGSGGTGDPDLLPIVTGPSPIAGDDPDDRLILTTVSPNNRRAPAVPPTPSTPSGGGGGQLAGVTVVPSPMTVVLLVSALAFGTLVRRSARQS